MKDFDEDTEDAKLLRKDLEELKRRFGGDGKIHMELNFSSKYPIEPVFIRVVSPRMLQYTGNVTIGGAVCSEFSVEKYQPDWKISEIMRMVRLNMLTAPKVYVKTQFGPGGRAGPLRVDLNGRDHLGSPLREYREPRRNRVSDEPWSITSRMDGDVCIKSSKLNTVRMQTKYYKIRLLVLWAIFTFLVL